MFPTVCLVNVHLHIYLNFFVLRNFRIYSLRNFHTFNMVLLLTIVHHAVHTSPGFTHFISLYLYLFHPPRHSNVSFFKGFFK